MGKGEGWGERNDDGNRKWKGTLCGSCDFGPKCLLGCCCPGFGNYFVAEKMGSNDFTKWIGFLDYLGGGFVFSAFGAWTLRKKYAREMVLTVMTSRIAAYHFAALNVFNASMPTT